MTCHPVGVIVPEEARQELEVDYAFIFIFHEVCGKEKGETDGFGPDRKCRPLASSRDSVAGFTLSVHNAPKSKNIFSWLTL